MGSNQDLPGATYHLFGRSNYAMTKDVRAVLAQQRGDITSAIQADSSSSDSSGDSGNRGGRSHVKGGGLDPNLDDDASSAPPAAAVAPTTSSVSSSVVLSDDCLKEETELYFNKYNDILDGLNDYTLEVKKAAFSFDKEGTETYFKTRPLNLLNLLKSTSDVLRGSKPIITSAAKGYTSKRSNIGFIAKTFAGPLNATVTRMVNTLPLDTEDALLMQRDVQQMLAGMFTGPADTLAAEMTMFISKLEADIKDTQAAWPAVPNSVKVVLLAGVAEWACAKMFFIRKTFCNLMYGMGKSVLGMGAIVGAPEMPFQPSEAPAINPSSPATPEDAAAAVEMPAAASDIMPGAAPAASDATEEQGSAMAAAAAGEQVVQGMHNLNV